MEFTKGQRVIVKSISDEQHGIFIGVDPNDGSVLTELVGGDPTEGWRGRFGDLVVQSLGVNPDKRYWWSDPEDIQPL